MPPKVNRVTNANVYVEGESFLGKCDKVTLPSLKQIMDDHKGLGMQSSLKLPSGGLDNMEAKFMWASFYPEVLRRTADPTKAVKLQVRASIDEFTGAGLTGQSPLVVSLGGIFTELPLGDFEKQKNLTHEDTMTVYYIKVVADGEELVEVDVLNNIYRVAGVDLLSRFREIIGA